MNVDAIPLELRERDQWVVWKSVDRDGKTTKIPLRADKGGPASSTDPSTWATFFPDSSNPYSSASDRPPVTRVYAVGASSRTVVDAPGSQVFSASPVRYLRAVS